MTNSQFTQLKDIMTVQFGRIDERFAKNDERFDQFDDQFSRFYTYFTSEIKSVRNEIADFRQETSVKFDRVYTHLDEIRGILDKDELEIGSQAMQLDRHEEALASHDGRLNRLEEPAI